jgi:hypothetical protein
MTSTETRADRFIRELAELKIPDPAAGRPRLWLRLGFWMARQSYDLAQFAERLPDQGAGDLTSTNSSPR